MEFVQKLHNVLFTRTHTHSHAARECDWYVRELLISTVWIILAHWKLFLYQKIFLVWCNENFVSFFWRYTYQIWAMSIAVTIHLKKIGKCDLMRWRVCLNVFIFDRVYIWLDIRKISRFVIYFLLTWAQWSLISESLISFE